MVVPFLFCVLFFASILSSSAFLGYIAPFLFSIPSPTGFLGYTAFSFSLMPSCTDLLGYTAFSFSLIPSPTGPLGYTAFSFSLIPSLTGLPWVYSLFLLSYTPSHWPSLGIQPFPSLLYPLPPVPLGILHPFLFSIPSFSSFLKYIVLPGIENPCPNPDIPELRQGFCPYAAYLLFIPYFATSKSA